MNSDYDHATEKPTPLKTTHSNHVIRPAEQHGQQWLCQELNIHFELLHDFNLDCC